jgi:hypothetical protein
MGSLYFKASDQKLYYRQSGGDEVGPLVESGGGTVTSVGLSMPSIFSVSGSPVTAAGTLSVSLGVQAPNQVFAGPISGASAPPTFRSLVADDIPGLPASKITSGSLASNLFGNGIATSAGINAGSYSLQGSEIIYLSDGDSTIGITGVGNFGSVEVDSGTVITSSRQMIHIHYHQAGEPTLANREIAQWTDGGGYVWLIARDQYGTQRKVQIT